MSQLKAKCSHTVAAGLAAGGAFKATINGQRCFVEANVWQPVSQGEGEAHYVVARPIVNEASNVEAEGTREGTVAEKAVVATLTWVSA